MLSQEAKLVQKYDDSLREVYHHIIEHGIIGAYRTMAERDKAVEQMTRSNNYGGFENTIKTLCKNQKHKEELHSLLHKANSTLQQICVPQDYLSFISKIHTEAYAEFRASNIAADMIPKWKTVAPEFINMKTGNLNQTNGYFKDGQYGKVITDKAKKKLENAGIPVEKGFELVKAITQSLHNQWNKALPMGLQMPDINIYPFSEKHPEFPCSVTQRKDGSTYYTIGEDSYMFADYRWLFQVAHHEPEHSFQLFCCSLNQEELEASSFSKMNKRFQSIITQGHFCPVNFYDIHDSNKTGVMDTDKHSPWGVALNIYYTNALETAANQHGYLAELQLGKETGIPLRHQLRDFLREKKHYVAAMPEPLVPNQSPMHQTPQPT